MAHLPALAKLIVYSFDALTTWNQAFSGCSHGCSSPIRTLVIGNCPILQLDPSDLKDAVGLTSYKLVANSGVTQIPTLYFQHTLDLENVEIVFNRQLGTLPSPLFPNGLTDTATRTITLQAIQGLDSLAADTFSSIGRVERLTIHGESRLSISQSAFANIGGTITTLDIAGLSLADVTPSTFAGATVTNLVIGKVSQTGRSARLTQLDSIKTIPGLQSLDVRYNHAGGGLSGELDSPTLQTVRMRCVSGVRMLVRGLFTASNRDLERVSFTEMPDLDEVQSSFFRGPPILRSVEMSHNPSWRELGTNTFDGAFLSTAGQVRVDLLGSAFRTISRRTFNFDANGISGNAVINLGSANNSWLSSCCGYHWLESDAHFITASLTCDSTPFDRGRANLTSVSCCNHHKAAMRSMVSSSEDLFVVGYGVLNTTLRSQLQDLCVNAAWHLDGTVGRWVRNASAAQAPTASDTAPSFRVTQMYTGLLPPPGANTCVNATVGCPEGYLAELDGKLAVLDCEPWKHEVQPSSYLTQHFIGDRACFPCGVVGCSICADDPRECDKCLSRSATGELAVHSNVSGVFCLESCPDGHLSATRTADGGTTGLFCEAVVVVEADSDNPNIVNSDDGNSVEEWTILISVVVAALFVALIAVLAVNIVRTRRANAKHDFTDVMSHLHLDGGKVDSSGRRIPEEIPRARITAIKEVGQGEFAVVWKGMYRPKKTGHIEMQTPVAFKELKSDPTTHERDELMREAAITAQFVHDNVIGLVGVVTIGAPALIVLQFCEKGSLGEILVAGKDQLGVATLVRYSYEMACGMEYLSSRFFVHRDL